MYRKRRVIRIAIHSGGVQHFLKCCLNLVLSLLLIKTIFYQEDILRKTFKKLPGNVEVAPQAVCMYVSGVQHSDGTTSSLRSVELKQGNIIILRVKSTLSSINGLNIEILPELKNNFDKKNIKFTVYSDPELNTPIETGITKLPFVFEERNLIITFKKPVEIIADNQAISIKIEMIGAGRLTVPIAPTGIGKNMATENCVPALSNAMHLNNKPNIVLRGESSPIDLQSFIK